MKIFKSTAGLLTAIALIFIISSCEELFNQMGLDIFSDYQEMEFTIEPMPAGEYSITESMDAVDIDSLLTDAGAVSLNGLEISTATLEIADNDGSKNFNAFESFEVSINTNILPETTIGVITDVPDDVDKLDFVLLDENLVNYMDGDYYELKVKGILDEDITEPLDVIGKVRFKVDVGM